MAESADKVDTQKLAKELDEKLDNFIESLPRRNYDGGLSEENWEEEIEKIPLFMKELPEDMNESPSLVGLQEIKYASEESTKEDNALTHKDDGNHWFKKKLYKQAVRAYTEGLKEKCGNTELNAILYTNRAAAHFHLGNHRSSLNDAKEALNLKPDHLKAALRVIQSCMELKDYSEAVLWCDRGLQISSKNEVMINTRAKASKLKKTADREKRKEQLKEKKQRAMDEKLVNAIKSRSIQFWKEPTEEDDDEEEDEGQKIRSIVTSLTSNEVSGRAIVSIDEEGVLHWPVRFLYPEHGQSDLISAFNENTRFLDHLEVMFSVNEAPPAWDPSREYRVENLKVYFEDYHSNSLVEVKPKQTLLKTLQHPRYVIVGGVPTFFLLSTATPYHEQFLQKYVK
ncbi:tetratricopeptide repeat protein 4-like [Diadema antillarum]|uniref:tetratricopeptide repeat protein 4-like n=1 Tax=Diadema antillarum TaxID=105358 RepID=UPI003A84719F